MELHCTDCGTTFVATSDSEADEEFQGGFFLYKGEVLFIVHLIRCPSCESGFNLEIA